MSNRVNHAGRAHDAHHETSFARLRDFVVQLSGMSYFETNANWLQHAVEHRMRLTDSHDLDDYHRLLTDPESGNGEFEKLASEMTIGETYFNRLPAQFEFLMSSIIPRCLDERRAERKLRIWSAGCASGAEPYSVAIHLEREFGARLADWDVTIVATDLNRKLIERARSGVFTRWELRDMPTDDIAELFCEQAGDRWVLRRRFADWINFQIHNLVQDPVPSAQHGIIDCDVILCRNVMIYFNGETNEALVPRLSEALADHGWLLTGASDPCIGLRSDFVSESPASTFAFRKKEAAPRCEKTGTAPEALRWMAPAAATPPEPVCPAAPASRDAPSRAQVRRAGTPDTLDDLQDCLDRGAWERANDLVQRHASRWRGSSRFHALKGLAEQHVGSLEASLDSFRDAVYIDPADPMAHYLLGNAAALCGKNRLAIRSYRNALRAAGNLQENSHWPGVTVMQLENMARTQLSALGEK